MERDVHCTVCASVRRWTFHVGHILKQHRRHYQAWNVPPGSFAELMIREAARFRAMVDRPGPPESVTQERQRYERLSALLLPLYEALESWSDAHVRQLVDRVWEHQIAWLLPEERERIYAWRQHPSKKRMHRPPQREADISRLADPVDTRKQDFTGMIITDPVDTLEQDFARMISGVWALMPILSCVLDGLPDPPTHRPAGTAPLKDCVKRLRAIYKHTVGKEPGKGNGPFAKGVYHFVRAVHRDFNASTDGITMLVKRTLT
jgi:hypothetical protein